MRRSVKRLIITIVLTALAGTVGFWFASSSKKPAELVTETVHIRNLVQTVEATGAIESISDASLSFDLSGTVKEVFVKVGDHVALNDLLATLDTSELAADAENARKAVESAQANLNAKNAGAADVTVAISSAGVAVAQANLASAKIDVQNAERKLASAITLTESAVRQSEATVSTRQTTLANAKLSVAQDEKETAEDYVTSLYDAAIAVRSGLSDADRVLGIDNSLATTDFRNVLSVTDEQAKISAENAYRAAKITRNAAETKVFALSFSAPASQTSTIVPAVEAALKDAETTLLETRRALDGTVIDTADFSFTDLVNLKTAVDSARINIQAKRSVLLNARQAVQRARIEGDASIGSAEESAVEAERAFTQAKADRENSIVSAQASLDAARSALAVREANLLQDQARLTEAAARPRAVDVAALIADVQRSQASYEASMARLAKAELHSPIEGTVTSVEIDPGELASPSLAAIEVESNGEVFRLVVDVAEADIAKVQVPNSAVITLDAFGEDVLVVGNVTKIDPSEKLVEGVVFYRVTLDLTGTLPSAGLKSGMSANVVVQTNDRQAVVAVPQRAVLERAGKKYVRVFNGAIIERTVTTGLRADNGLVEILSGLSVGETLIVTVRN